jgi:ferrous iron transport protein B
VRRNDDGLTGSSPPIREHLFTVALVGNPNAGKTTLFNALTGLRQKVANYPGVTVDIKEGKLVNAGSYMARLLDLPGTYSLTPHSPDEKIATDFVLGRADHLDLVVCVVDATHLERNLFLATQLIERRIPLIIALTLSDIAHKEGTAIDTALLSRELDVPVIPVVAADGIGIVELKSRIGTPPPPSRRSWSVPAPYQPETDAGEDGADAASDIIEKRYARIREMCAHAVQHHATREISPTDRIDRYATHRIWGPLIFIFLMAFMFQSIFSWATYPMEIIGSVFDALGSLISSVLPPGDLHDLLVNGALAGVAGVVTFIPQIVFLFLFLGILEDSGYMARAAFIMERVMRRVGLNGRSFIPLLGSFACAIPGIMATRTIDNPKDRLATMLIAPLMSCSARLPVYTLLIAAFVPSTMLFGVFSLPGLTLLSLYVLGLLAALAVAALFKRTFLKGAPPPFIIELPPYHVPSLKTVLYQVWEKALSFLKTAGTIILGASIILWFLASYPKLDHGSRAEQLEHSFAGRMGKTMEPVLHPLGFDWKIGIGLVSSLMQREAFVSTMATIYNLRTEDGKSTSLREALRHDVDPQTGAHHFTLLTALCLMVYYVLAMQCLSTFAIMRRETRSWRWPFFQLVYMTVLAYGGTFLVYRIGLGIGWGG